MCRSHRKDLSMGVFDGYAQQEGCGGGSILYINVDHYLNMKMGLARGTNNYAELNSLRFLLIFSLEKGWWQLHIFYNSKLLINWFNQQSNCHVYTLRNQLEEVIILKSKFDYVICHHIYREMISQSLSKEAAQQHFGIWMILEAPT